MKNIIARSVKKNTSSLAMMLMIALCFFVGSSVDTRAFEAKPQAVNAKTIKKTSKAVRKTKHPVSAKPTTVKQATRDPLTLLPDMVKGSNSAPITIIEYGSATCGHCAAWYNKNWAEFEKKYISTGKVRYIFREVLTDPVELDLAIYLLARCASQKPIQNPNQKPILKNSPKPANSAAYFTIVDGFFRQQKDIFASGNAGPALKTLSLDAGLNEAEFNACLKKNELFQDLQAHIAARNEADNVEQTPTFFVNAKRMTGDTELKDFDAAIAAAQP